MQINNAAAEKVWRKTIMKGREREAECLSGTYKARSLIPSTTKVVEWFIYNSEYFRGVQELHMRYVYLAINFYLCDYFIDTKIKK